MAMKTRKRLAGSRVTRKQLKRDPFVDRVFDWTLWARENARKVAVAAGVVALAALALVLYRQSRAGQAREAAERYQEIWAAYAAGNYQLAANDFRQFRVQFSGSDYADEAAVYLADSYYQVGDYPEAIRVLQDFEEQHHDSPLDYAATSLLGAAYEASGDWVKAAEVYGAAREGGRFDYQKVEARMNEARVRVAAGEREKAAEAYRAVIEQHPDTPRAGEARVRLVELTVQPLRSEAAASPVAGVAATEPVAEDSEAASDADPVTGAPSQPTPAAEPATAGAP